MGFTQSDMALAIEKTLDSYAKKERGEIEFTTAEMVLVTKKLNLSASEFSAIFFDSQLPFFN